MTDITPYDGGALRPADVIHQLSLVQEVMGAVMKDGEHYGKIPGCGDKPALLQPGAQVLAFTFRLAPSFDIETKDMPNLHREYVVRCSLASIQTGQMVGMGIGSCSTMESKYRYRNVSDFEVTGDPIPADSKERKKEYRKQGFGMKKVDGVWEWVKFKDSEKVENPDIADTYNTVLKMATKRAFVHAVLNATAASDMFTQDIEDLMSRDEPPRATASQVDAISALFDDLGWDDAMRANKLNQAGAKRVDLLTESNASRLIVNLGEVLKRKSSTPEPDPVEPDLATAEEIPF